MKNFLLSIIILSSIICNGQSFKFDLLTKYSTESFDFYRESVVYSNSKNSDYFLFVRENTATICDLKNTTLHHFNVLKKTSNNGEIFYEFFYESSEHTNYHYRLIHNDFKIISNDTLYKKVLLNFFYNKKKRKIDHSIEMKIKNHSANLFPLFRFSCLHGYDYRKDLNFSNNGIVEYATCKIRGNKVDYKLLYYHELNFELVVEPKFN
jgi:hypothetical protein